METRRGKASAPSAGGRERVQPEPRDKTQGNYAASNSRSDSKEHLDVFVTQVWYQHGGFSV